MKKTLFAALMAAGLPFIAACTQSVEQAERDVQRTADQARQEVREEQRELQDVKQDAAERVARQERRVQEAAREGNEEIREEQRDVQEARREEVRDDARRANDDITPIPGATDRPAVPGSGTTVPANRPADVDIDVNRGPNGGVDVDVNRNP